jgi:hypothetical protein
MNRNRQNPDTELTTAPPQRTDPEREDDQHSRWSSLGGAPRWNRTGDPILTMEPPEPLCGTPFSQVTPDRRGQSYRFSFGEVMRSLSNHALIVADASHNPR